MCLLYPLGLKYRTLVQRWEARGELENGQVGEKEREQDENK